jgi:signal transduction histidine kinase
MAAGHFDERVSVQTKDELGSLGRSINDMAQKLSTIEKKRTQFISEISHELRTPLTTIRTTLQGISEGIVDVKEDYELISISAEETKRLGTLIDELLDLSSFEEKSVILSPETLSLTDLLEKCLLLFKTKANEKSITLRAQLENDISVYGDRDRLQQVIINLLDNALKHSASHSLVDIHLFKSRHYTQVDFTNYGAPIPKEELPYIFERFYKIDKSRTKKGSGLGLTISKQIVELHKGSLTVQSDVQKTIFTLKFLHKEVSQ